MTMVTVYTTGSGCPQCALTERVLTAARIPFTDVDLTDDANAAARDYVASEPGYSRAPVVVVDDNDHWSGVPTRPHQPASPPTSDKIMIPLSALVPGETIAEAGEPIRGAAPILGEGATDEDCRFLRELIDDTLTARAIHPGARVWHTALLGGGRIAGVWATSVEEAELELTVWCGIRCHWVRPDRESRPLTECHPRGKRSATGADRRFPLGPPRRRRDQSAPTASLFDDIRTPAARSNRPAPT